VGERWTLLILRDLFFGVRRFSDLQRHLNIPRAVLSARLASLVDAGLVEREPYRLTERGADLWPAVHALMQWGEKHESPGGRRRVFVHVECGTQIGPATPIRDDAVTLALREPHRLMTPLAG
jgi:DNA-binding HxlR family transcriptional regulator